MTRRSDELNGLLAENRQLRAELGSSKQKLFNAEGQLRIATEAVDEAHRLQAQLWSMEQELAACSALQLSPFDLRDAVCRLEALNEIGDDRLQSQSDAADRELSALKRQLRKERTRGDVARQQALDLEAQLHQRLRENGELKHQEQVLHDSQQQRLQAAALKYQALTAVCARQELHIGDLYRHLERVRGSHEGVKGQAVQIPTRSGPRELQGSWTGTHGSGGSGRSDLYLPVLFREIDGSGEWAQGKYSDG